MTSTVPVWLRARARGLGLAPTVQQFAYVAGATVTAQPAVAGSTIVVVIGDPNIVNPQVPSPTPGVSNVAVCTPNAFANPPVTCPNNFTQVTLTLDGTAGTVTVAGQKSGFQSSTPVDPFTIVIPGYSFVIPPGIPLAPRSPSPTSSPTGSPTAGATNPPAGSASSSSSSSAGTIAAIVAAVVLVAGGAWYFSREHGAKA